MKLSLFFFLISKIINDSCDTYNNQYGCIFGQNHYSEEWDNYCFQTPPRDDILGYYKETYQDMHYLVGYSQLIYSYSKTQCTINFITKVNPILGTEGIDYKILYKFGNDEQYNNKYILTNNNLYPNGLSLSATIFDNDNKEIAKLELEKEYFIWDNVSINQNNEYQNGQKGVIVELFGWPYEDISYECEFLNTAGYIGVKITPPNESILTYDIVEEGELNPWWYFLQPVSYKLESRLGNKKQLKNMINICRSHNIRIYSQVVINHMAGNGNDMYEIHKKEDCSTWGAKTGSAGSPFWTTKGRYEYNPYTGNIPVIEFPSVPYFASDFHCYLDFENEKDIYQLNYHWIKELSDLNTGKEYVQQRIADFLTELLSIGISGISIINARHISPDDYVSIFGKFKKNLGDLEFPEDFIAILELSYENNKDILLNDGEYSFGEPFTEKLKNIGLTDNDINKIKIGNEEPDALPIYDDEWKINQSRHVMSFENYDIQKIDSNNDFSYIITKDIDIHRNKVIEILKRNDIDWKIKIIFSSYSLNGQANGFPDGKSDCSKCKTINCKKYCNKNASYTKAYDPLSKGYDAGNSENWREGVYTRIHRDIKIINSMREWMNFSILTEDELFEKEKLNAYNCTENRPFIIVENGLCSMECSVSDFFNKICKIKNEDSQKAKSILIENIEKEIMEGSIDELLYNVIMNEKNDLIVSNDNIIYQITSSYNQNNKKYANISSLELGECESILKEKYNISQSETLIILKVEHYQEGILFPIIEYEIFHPITKQQLNLEYCINTTISLSVPVSIDEDNLNKYNITSDYYNNRCSPYTTEKSTDITLKDRANEYINNNLTLCEDNCEFNGYDIISKKIKCECDAKTKFEYVVEEYSFDKQKLINNFKNLKKTLNLAVFKCYYVLFTKDGFTKNIGNFIVLSIIIIYYFLRNFFFIKGYDLFKLKVIKMLKIKDLNNNSIYTKNNFIKNEDKNKMHDTQTIDENINPDIKNDININPNNIKENTIENIENKINNNIIDEMNNDLSNKTILDLNIYNKKNVNNKKSYKNKFKFGCKTLKERTNYNINDNNNAPTKKVKIKKKRTINPRNLVSLNSITCKSTYNNNLRFSKSNNNVSSSINEINKNNIFLNNKMNNNNCNENKGTIEINNNSIDYTSYANYNDYELNNLPYHLALEIDKRNYFKYYLSLLKTNHLLIFTFYNFNDYNSIVIKICLFLFYFSLNFTVNALFFTESKMHTIYNDGGKYDFIYSLPYILYSTIITALINSLIKYISLSQKIILEFKNEKNFQNYNEQLESVFKCLLIRFTYFFDISFIFLLVFWYYLSCFCAVYRNTQIYLIKDTFISFGFSLLYQFTIYLIPGIFRIQSLKDENSNKECMYRVSKLFQML